MDEKHLRELEDKILLKEAQKNLLAAEIAEIKVEIMLLQSGKTKEDIENMRKRPRKTFDEIFEEAFGIDLSRRQR